MTTPTKRASKAQANGVVPKQPTASVEVGVSAFLPFVTPYKNMWETLRWDEITVKQLAAMRKTDGQARALYRLITLPIRAALKTATFVPEDNVEGGEEEAEFIQQLFTLPPSAGGMEVPFSRVIAQMLLAIFDGFTAFEMVYWTPDKGPLKGKWTLQKLAHRPAETLTFLIDDKSRFTGLRQRTMYLGHEIDVVIDAADVMYYAAQEEERPFYGRSYFESAWYHWDKKFKLYVIAHLAAQRAAVGTRVGKVPLNPGREDLEAFKKALADLGAAQYMTIPENWAVESLKEFAGFDFLAYINHHNSQMSKSGLAGFFDKEQGGGDAGKLVDFGTQSDALFMLMLQTIMAEIEQVINTTIIPRFIDWNFNSQKYPAFAFGSLSEEQKSAMLELFKTLAVAGQSLTIRPELVHELEKQVSELLGLEVDWDTVEEEMAEEKEMLAAQAMMEGQDAMNPAAPGAAGGTAPPQVDAALLPQGFTLSHVDPNIVVLNDLAWDLLDEAYQTVELVRGKPNSGGPKYVRTAEGARVYGEPVGTPITRDMRERLKAHGVKGKVFGEGIRDPNKSKTGREVLGGGPGAKAQSMGSVATEPNLGGGQIVATFSHPDQPGVQLLDFGDGTVAIRDAQGNISARQRFDIGSFLKLGWKIDAAYADKYEENKKAAGAKDKPAAKDKAAGKDKGTTKT